jgi:hypothetical protein
MGGTYWYFGAKIKTLSYSSMSADLGQPGAEHFMTAFHDGKAVLVPNSSGCVPQLLQLLLAGEKTNSLTGR